MPIKLPAGISQRRFDSAIRELQEIVGSEWVFTSEADVETYRDSYSIRWGHDDEYFASAAVAPASVEEVQGIVRIANEYEIPVYSISTGKNLTYGGAAPTYSGSIVLDLKRMNRVLEIDDKRNFAVVEPGCSYFDLYEYIQSRGLKVWIDCPDPGWGSPLGNALDNGVGYTGSPFRDHWGAHCGLEVVLANGDIIRTGMGANPNSESWQDYRYGAGPDVDGLFTQGNYGVVTKMGFWLMPQPEAWFTGTVTVPKYSDLAELIRQHNYLEDSLLLNGRTTFGSAYGGFGGGGGLREEVSALVAGGWPTTAELDAFVERTGQPAWTLQMQFFGPEKSLQARWDYVQRRISEAIPGATFGDEEMLTMPLSPAQETTHRRVDFGIPNMSNYGMMARRPGVIDPPDGHSDFLVVASRSADSVHRFARTNYEMQMELGLPVTASPFATPVTWFPRFFLMGAAGIWTQHNDPELNMEGRIQFEAMIRKFSAAGYPNYRTNPSNFDVLAEQFSFNNNALLRFQETLKDAADPNGILSPGRYGIWPKRLREDRA
ncbi:MAG: p-cresol methylhydroxylase [SAR86 cluster bacterium]|uniref:p-cresol methylhydroxylase n=1 Tax=SAR86 cluster bacterium TaxID=2030880 RepID=A0A2A5C708_9GAMM|nr:MAG: p-cresol methylhydroxylase [SAR86 cluster bacterium]